MARRYAIERLRAPAQPTGTPTGAAGTTATTSATLPAYQPITPVASAAQARYATARRRQAGAPGGPHSLQSAVESAFQQLLEGGYGLKPEEEEEIYERYSEGVLEEQKEREEALAEEMSALNMYGSGPHQERLSELQTETQRSLDQFRRDLAIQTALGRGAEQLGILSAASAYQAGKQDLAYRYATLQAQREQAEAGREESGWQRILSLLPYAGKAAGYLIGGLGGTAAETAGEIIGAGFRGGRY